MRIALVHPRLDHRGGAENVVLWMARGLLARGHEVVVATGRFSEERWGARDWEGIPLRLLDRGFLDAWKPRGVRKRGPGRRLGRVLGACDWIVAHNAPAPMWATVAARRLPGTRVAWFCEEPSARFYLSETMPHLVAALEDRARHPWLDGLDAWYAKHRAEEQSRRVVSNRRLDRAAAPRVDLVLGNSQFTANATARIYGIRTLPCILGVPEPEPVPGAADGSEPYVGWITSGVAHKNALGFLEALRIAVHELGLRDLRVRAVGLGGGAFADRLRALDLEASVVCEGWLSDDEMNRLVARSRLLAYPAIDEPFGIVPVHAMAHARPVLAGRYGGPAETVLDGVTGVHVDPLDPRDMATRLAELWRDPARCDALGAAGRERFLARFTFEHFLDRFEASLCGEVAAPAGRERALAATA